MDNKNYNDYFKGSNVFDTIEQNQKIELTQLATKLAHSIFTPHAHLKQFYEFASHLDNILYSSNQDSLIQAQYFSNVYFKELILKGFELRQDKKSNPLNIIVDYKQQKISNASIYLTSASEEKIFSTINKEYQKYHSKELVNIKVNYLKNLQHAQWANGYGANQAFHVLLQKSYVDENITLNQVKALVEKEKLDNVLEKDIPNLVKSPKKI